MCSAAKNTYISPRDTEIPSKFPSISQPKIIGSFSLNEKRKYLPDTRNCKYVYKHYDSERVNYDLNEGIENVIRKPESGSDEKLTHLLEFIVRNKQKLIAINPNNGKNRILPDFVCFRGLLRLIMCTPYEHRDAWIILATKYKGTIYLCAEETEKQLNERLNRTDVSKRILSYGFKFEQFILTGERIDTYGSASENIYGMDFETFPSCIIFFQYFIYLLQEFFISIQNIEIYP